MGILNGKLKWLKSLAATAAKEEDGYYSDAGKAYAAASLKDHQAGFDSRVTKKAWHGKTRAQQIGTKHAWA